MPDDPRSLPGASLPPRKRLLAGLKQNGWLSSYAGAWHSTGAPCSDLMDEVKLEVDLGGAKLVEQASACPLGGECSLVDAAGAAIVQAVGSNADENSDSDRSRKGSKRPRSDSPTGDPRAAVKKLPQMTTESRKHRESKLPKKTKGSKAVLCSNSASTAAHLKKETLSHSEMAAAAKLTAEKAAKCAAEAKAIAADKAAVAAKAAAVAKAALEAVAIAASDEAWKPRRNLIRRHPKVSISDEKQKSWEFDLKNEVQSVRVSRMPAPVDDEELARQLHRAMNSSPRISRSVAPLKHPKEDEASLSPRQRHFHGKLRHRRRRSSSLKDVDDQVVKNSRHSFDSPRSRCVEPDVKLKSMSTITETMPCDSSLQGGKFPEHGFYDDTASHGHADHGSRLKKADLERSGAKNEKKPRKKYINEDHLSSGYRDGESVQKSTAASINESVYCNEQAYFNSNSEDWAIKCKVVDVEHTVNQSAPVLREGKVGMTGNASKKNLGKNELVECANDMQDKCSERDSEDNKKEFDIIIEKQLAGVNLKGALNGFKESGKQVDADRPHLLPQNLGCKEINWKGEAGSTGLSVSSNVQEENLRQEDTKESSAVEHPLKRTCSDNMSKAVLKTLSQATHGHADGQAWHPEIIKGLPMGLSAGKQTFGGSMGLSPFISAPTVTLRTPTFASGPTGRHL